MCEGVPEGVAGTSRLHRWVVIDKADISGIGITRADKVRITLWSLCGSFSIHHYYPLLCMIRYCWGKALPFFVFPVSMLWIDIHTDSTLCTGDQPFPELSKSRQMMPFE